MNEYMKRRWKERRISAVIQLGGCCVRCGTTESLEFDHIDPSTKTATIARLLHFLKRDFKKSYKSVNCCANRVMN